MKLTSAFLMTLALSTAAYAQYFSEGWKPGQPVSKPAPTSTGFNPAATQAQTPESTEAAAKAPFNPLDLSSYLELSPFKKLFGSAGVNITERLEAARQSSKFWDPRIPFINDYNYQDLVVNEDLTLQEEVDRVWFFIITISSAQLEGISRFVDEQFDKAYDLAERSGDLSHVKWGRIDYMNVTALTTKWGIWRAPFLVVATHRGDTLRFIRPHQIRQTPELIHAFLKSEAYLRLEPWNSSFAPGGSRAFILDWLALVLVKIYSVVVIFPRWMLLLLGGTLGSVLVNLMHRKSSSQPASARAPAPATQKVQAAAVQPPATPSPAQGSSQSSTKQRKGKKLQS